MSSGFDALTAEGRVVRIRPVRPDDEVGLRKLYEDASLRSRYLRFFSAGLAVEPEVRRLIRSTGGEHVALVAEDAGTVVGVAVYERLDAERAEFAVLVADDHQGQGIGTLLLEHLAARARRAGIGELIGDVLAENSTMLRVMDDLDAEATRLPPLEDDVVQVRLPSLPDEAALAAIETRNQAAERHSLRPLFTPRSVAVVGAGRKPGGVGHEILTSLLTHGFTGEVYPVNPHAHHVAGVAAYPDVSAIGTRVDLAVVAVPAEAVPTVIADCAAAGVGAAVLISAGFGETGAEGRAEQARMVRLARARGLRLVGPNCLGVINTDPAVRLTAAFTPSVPPPGGLAVAAQSGAVGIAILDHAARTGIGVSSFVSLGNKADVSGNDLLAYWYDDPATQAVALYLESLGNPRRFARIARAVARRKPVLVVKSGRSASGQRAGTSHTAAAAVPDVAVDALFAQAGVIRTDTLGELLDAARMLVGQPLPPGDRLAVVGNAGGANVLAVDAAEGSGLTVPQLSAGLKAALPAGAAGDNPVDLGAAVTPQVLGDAVSVLAASGEVDIIIATLAATLTNDVPGCLRALGQAADDAPDIPVATVLIGAPDSPVTVGRRRIPVFTLPEPAVRAAGRAAVYAAWRDSPLGGRPELPDVDSQLARRLISGRIGWQDADLTAQVLSCYGIPVPRVITAGDAEASVVAAEELGYPVVLKTADASVVHKTDIGGVELDLGDADAVRAAYATITAATSYPAVTVQRMVDGDVELVAGVVHDPLFGPLVMLGLGGVYTDLLGDRTFRLSPVTDLDAGRMWRSLRSAPLLTGYRGSRPVDVAALEDLISRVDQLAEDLPEIAELDLNPVLAGPSGVVAVDAKLRLAPADADLDPYLRALREP